jgi:hypothetical protein
VEREIEQRNHAAGAQGQFGNGKVIEAMVASIVGETERAAGEEIEARVEAGEDRDAVAKLVADESGAFIEKHVHHDCDAAANSCTIGCLASSGAAIPRSCSTPFPTADEGRGRPAPPYRGRPHGTTRRSP